MIGADDDGFQIQISVSSLIVLLLDALDLDLFHEALIEGVHGIQHIDQVVLFFVSGRVVQAEQRLEVLQGLLRNLAAHLLRFVHDDNRAVGGDHIDRTPGTEVVALRVDDTGGLVSTAPFDVLFFVQGRGERLCVDDHDIDSGVAGKIVQFSEVGAAVDEESRLLAVQLHEMVLRHLERLLHALADRDARHDHNELAPAVPLVQLEHSLDVDVGLARAGLHFDVERASSNVLHQFCRTLHVVCVLNLMDVVEQFVFRQLDLMVAEPVRFIGVPIRAGQHILLAFPEFRAHIPHIGGVLVFLLTVENGYDAFHRVSLVFLDFEFEFHYITSWNRIRSCY